MPSINVYFTREMYLKLQEEGDVSKTVQEAVTLFWAAKKRKKIKKEREN